MFYTWHYLSQPCLNVTITIHSSAMLTFHTPPLYLTCSHHQLVTRHHQRPSPHTMPCTTSSPRPNSRPSHAVHHHSTAPSLAPEPPPHATRHFTKLLTSSSHRQKLTLFHSVRHYTASTHRPPPASYSNTTHDRKSRRKTS